MHKQVTKNNLNSKSRYFNLPPLRTHAGELGRCLKIKGQKSSSQIRFQIMVGPVRTNKYLTADQDHKYVWYHSIFSFKLFFHIPPDILVLYRSDKVLKLISDQDLNLVTRCFLAKEYQRRWSLNSSLSPPGLKDVPLIQSFIEEPPLSAPSL